MQHYEQVRTAVPHVDRMVWLQADAQADESRLARLEFGFLHILGRQAVRAQTLERLLAREPAIFVDCLKLLYRPLHRTAEEESGEPVPQKEERALALRRLLNNWQRVPGTQSDGSISASELREWVSAVCSATREADRLEVCDVKIGEVFAHAPSDERDVKPCVPVREVIEACESDELARGFANGLFNLHGGYSKGLYEGGQQEREIAATYERYAKACETEWPRTAAALRSVAQNYLDIAAHEDAEVRMRK
jgi:hypothetical protein